MSNKRSRAKAVADRLPAGEPAVVWEPTIVLGGSVNAERALAFHEDFMQELMFLPEVNRALVALLKKHGFKDMWCAYHRVENADWFTDGIKRVSK